MSNGLNWLNEPPSWHENGGMVSVKTGEKTDFWRRTFYGFIRDDGHFYYRTVQGDFTAEVTINGRYEVLYDQAGLMLRLDERNWVKTGVEFTDGAMHFSVVVTRDDFSDWSVLGLPDAARDGIQVRLTRHAEAIRVQYRLSDGPWHLARLAYLEPRELVDVGLMCCTPERAGFEVEFHDFVVKEPISRQLHDDH